GFGLTNFQHQMGVFGSPVSIKNYRAPCCHCDDWMIPATTKNVQTIPIDPYSSFWPIRWHSLRDSDARGYTGVFLQRLAIDKHCFLKLRHLALARPEERCLRSPRAPWPQAGASRCHSQAALYCRSPRSLCPDERCAWASIVGIARIMLAFVQQEQIPEEELCDAGAWLRASACWASSRLP